MMAKIEWWSGTASPAAEAAYQDCKRTDGVMAADHIAFNAFDLASRRNSSHPHVTIRDWNAADYRRDQVKGKTP